MEREGPPSALAREFRSAYDRLKAEVGRVIAGQGEMVGQALLCLFTGGNVLLEGAPGLGKTLFVRTLAQALDLEFARLQFTPDLMPADITGTQILQDDGAGGRRMVFRPGPVFAQVVLADEINRAAPRTQSALLEAMQEYAVTVGGETRPMKEPFFVLATQNPLEMEGTYPLPEAQLDRFMMKITVPFPDREGIVEVMARTTGGETARPARVMDGAGLLRWRGVVRQVLAAPQVMDYAARLVLATHPGPGGAPAATRHVRCGASPRGAQAMLLAAKARALLEGRCHVAFEDIRALALPCLRHRIILNYDAEADGAAADHIVEEVVKTVDS